METYKLELNPEQAVKVPESIFNETNCLYDKLVEVRDDNIDNINFVRASLSSLLLGQNLLSTDKIIGGTPFGKDLIWLGLARAKTYFGMRCMDLSMAKETEYRDSFHEIDGALEKLVQPKPPSYFEYDVLGLAIKGYFKPRRFH